MDPDRGAGPSLQRPTEANAHDSAEMAAIREVDRFGIEIVSVKTYLWGGYRYSSARDAVAAAKRSAVK